MAELRFPKPAVGGSSPSTPAFQIVVRFDVSFEPLNDNAVIAGILLSSCRDGYLQTTRTETPAVSRDITTSPGATPPEQSSLAGEMLSSNVYKPNQGRIVRQVTALAIWVIVVMACWSLYKTLRGNLDPGSPLTKIIPAASLAFGLWFGYRVVNWPKFGDFLIAVEAEMNKVTWPSKDELIRASVVVIVTIFFLATALFGFDVLWQWLFDTIGVTS